MTHGKRAVSNSCSHLVENITTSNCVSFLSSLSLSRGSSRGGDQEVINLSTAFTEGLLDAEGVTSKPYGTSIHLQGNPPPWSQQLNYFSITAFLMYLACVNYAIMLTCQHLS